MISDIENSLLVKYLKNELSEEEHTRLAQAADEGNAMGFIMRPVSAHAHVTRHHSGLKIHSNLYH